MSTNASNTQERCGEQSDECVQEQEGQAEDPDPEHWPERGSEPDLEEEYKKLRLYVRMVARGNSDALMLEAPPGIGKSYQISNTLKDEVGANGYMKISGKASPLEFYHTLYEVSNGKVLFIDDIEGLINNKDALGLLKQATWSESATRKVEWRSTSDKLEVPEEFEFKGRIIMVFNEIPEDDDIVDSLKNRCVQYPINFTHRERMKIIREVAKKPYKSLSWDERMEVVDWIEDRAGPGDNVTLRLLFHIMDMRDFTAEDWELMAEEQLEFDPELARIRELCKMDEHETTKSVQEAWCDEMNKSRKTFFRRWSEIKEGLEDGESLL